MGVKNLWDILESCKKTLPLHHLQNKRVCIDLSCWIVQLQNVNKTYCAPRDKVYLRCLFHRLRALIGLNCSLIFVTDGSIPSIKLSTYRRRLNIGSEVPLEENYLTKVSSVRRNMESEFSCIIKEAKILGKALGIPCLDGVEEAEAQCALLNAQSLCDACFTSDSDAFLFGARTVYREICLGEGGYVVCYEMADIERKLGFGRNSLITFAVLLGGDYSEGVYGLGRESACQIVKSVGDSAVLQRIASEGLSLAKKPKGKGSKRKDQGFSQNHERDTDGHKCDLRSENQFLQVINAYLEPKCHPPLSDAVQRALAFYLFNRSQLQQICTTFFDWPPEKTDEYILPKIAERDLRRYANLRLASSKVGVRLSLLEMPVKCHISRILKQRKLQGKDCFEVSWEEMHGLKASIVPADLVESACPEKILEFQEERAQRKKAKQCKSRPKKLQNGISDIELKLQDLLLDIEQEERATVKAASLSRGAKLQKSRALTDLTNQELHLKARLESKSGKITSLNCSSTSSSLSGTEVVDSSSPPPPVYVRNVSKTNVADVQCTSVIDFERVRK